MKVLTVIFLVETPVLVSVATLLLLGLVVYSIYLLSTNKNRWFAILGFLLGVPLLFFVSFWIGENHFLFDIQKKIALTNRTQDYKGVIKVGAVLYCDKKSGKIKRLEFEE